MRKVFSLILLLHCVAFNVHSATKDVLVGTWIDVTFEESDGCGVARYYYSEVGIMNAATVFCSEENVIAVNYKTDWKITESGLLETNFISADSPFNSALSKEFKQSIYKIAELNENKLKLTNINTGEVFVYRKVIF